jgi:hypothetical protein
MGTIIRQKDSYVLRAGDLEYRVTIRSKPDFTGKRQDYGDV